MIPVRGRLISASASPLTVAATSWLGGRLGWWPTWLPASAWAAIACMASVPIALLAWALWPRSGPELPPDPEAVRTSIQHAEKTAAAAMQVVQLARALLQANGVPLMTAASSAAPDKSTMATAKVP